MSAPSDIAGLGLGGTGVGDWMVDTFIYTGLLIALVLLLRRPVARHFGAQVAYALWALPLLRLVMPPITLPAWMQPVPAAGEAGLADPLVVIVPGPAADPMAEAASAGITVSELLLPIWLGGAAIFLALRVRNYYRMRADLLADARPMGDAGRVRLVETPAVSAPVAFGIFDKVVALPTRFMALLDTDARDMAIAHELAHHRGHDLLANVAAQPLLALHWFNPLAWWGWRAMRRDQEAACDARVVAGRARSERVAYAEVIAGFAAGEHLALAAPMACPVLGEKSIIHRLRSLTMQDHSTTRRRIGIAAITTTALALPLTASITYARPDAAADFVDALSDVDEAPWQVENTQKDDQSIDIVERDGNREVTVRIRTDGDGGRRVVERSLRVGDGPVQQLSDAQLEAVLNRFEGDHARREIEADEVERHLERAERAREEAERIAERAHAGGDYGRQMAEYGRRMGEYGRAMGSYGSAEGRRARAQAIAARLSESEVRDLERRVGRLSLDCADADARGVVERRLPDGSRAIIACSGAAGLGARMGIEAAARAIASNPSIPAEARREAMRELHEAMREADEAVLEAELEARDIFDRTLPPAPPVPPRPPVPPQAALDSPAPALAFNIRWSDDASLTILRTVGLVATGDEDCEEGAHPAVTTAA